MTRSISASPALLAVLGGVLWLGTGMVGGPAQTGARAAAASAVPDFYRSNTAWSTRRGKELEPPPPGAPGARGPIGGHPDHPVRGNETGRPTPRIGNDGNPLLKPWAAAQMKKEREAILAGKWPYDPSESCWMPGVPAITSFGVAPFYFLQTPEEVTIVYERGQIARHVMMNRQHSANPKPTWHGESVGHYEGDTLVIDTIGISDRGFIDLFSTPHTTALRVVERYRIVGNELQMVITIDDPNTFTQPWSAYKAFTPATHAMEEVVCAEGGEDRFGRDVRPLPTAAKADF